MAIWWFFILTQTQLSPCPNFQSRLRVVLWAEPGEALRLRSSWSSCGSWAIRSRTCQAMCAVRTPASSWSCLGTLMNPQPIGIHPPASCCLKKSTLNAKVSLCLKSAGTHIKSVGDQTSRLRFSRGARPARPRARVERTVRWGKD